MSKKFKSQASSSRAASSTFGAPSSGFGGSSAFQTNTSPLSHVTEFPDLSSITDPKVKVALKNLTKKDSVTKTKALEDLLEFLSADAASLTEWQFLEAWVCLPGLDQGDDCNANLSFRPRSIPVHQ